MYRLPRNFEEEQPKIKMMDLIIPAPEYMNLAREILECERCAWRRPKRGYYPKFGGGSRQNALIFIVAQNPARPSSPEEDNGAWPDPNLALGANDKGLQDWLRRHSRGKFPAIAARAGFEWGRDIYMTEAIKCPRATPATDHELSEGRKACNWCLRREFEILHPKHVIPLGLQAYLAVGEATGMDLPPVSVMTWWETARKGIPGNGALMYPLFLPIRKVARTGSRATEFAQALERVFTLIAATERSQRRPAA